MKKFPQPFHERREWKKKTLSGKKKGFTRPNLFHPFIPNIKKKLQSTFREGSRFLSAVELNQSRISNLSNGSFRSDKTGTRTFFFCCLLTWTNRPVHSSEIIKACECLISISFHCPFLSFLSISLNFVLGRSRCLFIFTDDRLPRSALLRRHTNLM